MTEEKPPIVDEGIVPTPEKIEEPSEKSDDKPSKESKSDKKKYLYKTMRFPNEQRLDRFLEIVKFRIEKGLSYTESDVLNQMFEYCESEDYKLMKPFRTK